VSDSKWQSQCSFHETSVVSQESLETIPIWPFSSLGPWHDPAVVGNLISGSSSFSKTSLNIRKFTVHILLKPGLENFEQTITTVLDANFLWPSTCSVDSPIRWLAIGVV